MGNADARVTRAALLHNPVSCLSASQPTLFYHANDVHQDKRGDLSWYSPKCISLSLHLEDAKLWKRLLQK